MSGKSILITGCSSGIGYDAALGLRDRGWRVFATCRKQDDCDRLIREGLESFVLDYEDEASVASAAQRVLDETGGKIDALFNNGAYAIPGAVEDLSRDALRAIFEANLFGYHDLTNRLIPAMRANGSGRIVNCSSILGFLPLKWRGAYVSTKYAMEGLTDALRMELQGTGIQVSLIEPGPVTSRIRQNSRQYYERWIDEETSPNRDFYRSTLRKRLYEKGGKDPFELPASAVTRKLIHAIEAPKARQRYYVTAPTHMMAFLKRILPSSAFLWLVARG